MGRNEVRQNTASVGVVLTGVAEHVVFLTVAMKIKYCFNPASLSQPLDSPPNLSHLGMKHLRRLLPAAIEVYSCDIATKITINDSVYIDHGVYFDYTMLKQILYGFSLLEQATHHSQCHVGRPYFAWMLPCHKDHYSLFFFLALFPCNSYFRHFVIANSAADRTASKTDVVEGFGFRLDGL